MELIVAPSETYLPRKELYMRLAAQMRGGFYPAPMEAIAHAASFLRPPPEPWTICDPCAGEGAAIKQLGDLLVCPQSMIYAIELDDNRAEKVRDTLPEAHVLAPASFFGCRATMNSFTMIFLNPPFDDNYTSGRVETQFLQTATHWLKPNGRHPSSPSWIEYEKLKKSHAENNYELPQAAWIIARRMVHAPASANIRFGGTASQGIKNRCRPTTYCT